MCYIICSWHSCPCNNACLHLNRTIQISGYPFPSTTPAFDGPIILVLICDSGWSGGSGAEKMHGHACIFIFCILWASRPQVAAIFFLLAASPF